MTKPKSAEEVIEDVMYQYDHDPVDGVAAAEGVLANFAKSDLKRFLPEIKKLDKRVGQWVERFLKTGAIASFKGAVPGNLADNTKPSTPASQMETVELLKQGGILPPEENAEDYPVLTAAVKKEIIATLLKRKQPKLAMWASRNLKAVARGSLR